MLTLSSVFTFFLFPMTLRRKLPLVLMSMLLSISFLTFNTTSAISLESLKTSIDTATTKKGSTTNQISFLKLLQSVLTSPSFTRSDYAQIFSQLESYTAEKIKTLQTASSSTSSTSKTVKKSDGTSYFQLANVDNQKIRDTVLQWHNQERALV